MDYFQGVITASNVSYIKILGLRLLNSQQFGGVAYKAHHIHFENNYTYNTRVSGLSAWSSHDVLLNHNEVEKAVNGGEQECISVALSQNITVSNNHVHHKGTGNNGGEGIDIKQGSSYISVKNNDVHDLYNKPCFYIDAWDAYTHHITLDGNKAHDCYHDGFAISSEKGGTLDNITLENNIAYHNVGNGLTIGAWGLAGYHRPLKNIFILNNTFAYNGQVWGGGIAIENPEITNVVVKNNILSQNKSFQLIDEIGGNKTVLNNNLIDGFRAYEKTEVYGNNALIASPLFVDALNFDFHLLANSPAINKGLVLSPLLNHDFDNKPRPINSAIDLGAFEAQ